LAYTIAEGAALKGTIGIRVMTDWTRAIALLTCKQGVEAFRVVERLSDGDRALLMGETSARVYNWSASRG
jgi:hypothetical protein